MYLNTYTENKPKLYNSESAELQTLVTVHPLLSNG